MRGAKRATKNGELIFLPPMAKFCKVVPHEKAPRQPSFPLRLFPWLRARYTLNKAMHTQPPHDHTLPDFPLEQAVSPNQHGMRLDAFLALILPGLGVRARRRLWEWCHVRVNNKPRKPGFALQAGDVVRITVQEQSAEPQPTEPQPTGPQHVGLPAGSPPVNPALPGLLEASDGWLALYKPHGLHTAHVAGGNAQSLEGMLPSLWPTLCACMDPPAPPAALPRLVTRLDGPTAGIVLAVSDNTREQAFRAADAPGQVQPT